METPIYRRRGATRRGVIKAAAGLGLLASARPLVRPAYAEKKALKILQWSHFVPAYDEWFNNQYVKEWGAKNDTEVTVDNINLGLIPSRARSDQLPLGSMGRYRHEARYLGRRPDRRKKDQGQDRHSRGDWPIGRTG